jgi:hypothetical protein
VSNRRRHRGFERAGNLPYDGLGLPRARGRELVLAQAWAGAAGPAVASRTRSLQLRRGVLVVEVEEGPWSTTIDELLPRLAGRLARMRPELGLRSCRLAGQRSARRLAQPSSGPRQREAAAAAPALSTVRAKPGETAPPLGERLDELARRYLERGQGQNQ